MVQISNKMLATLIMLAMFISIFGIISAIIQINDIAPLIQGAPTSGEVNITVGTGSAINFTIANVTWGEGNVDQAKTSASVNTVGEVYNGNWTALNGGFVVENTGNSNVTFDLRASNTNDTFIGGTNPGFAFNVSDQESNSCTDGLTNFSDWVGFSTSNLRICYNFSFTASSDALIIGINLTIPEDSNTGTLSETIIGTATDCSC